MSKKRRKSRKNNNNNNRTSNVDRLVQASKLTQSFARQGGNLSREEKQSVTQLRRPLILMTRDKQFGRIAAGFIRIFNEMKAMDTTENEKEKLKHFANVDAIYKENTQLAQEVIG